MTTGTRFTPGLGRHLATVAAIVLLVAVAFGGSLAGEFVYDDTRQIVRNHLIQDPRQLGRAVTSDVWAFKAGQDEVRSNYWRPVFVLWLAVQYHLFGLSSAFAWHLASLALHAVVCVLAYTFGCRLGLPWPAAAGAAFLFAVHPSHAESVAWISGSPDLLAGAAMLGALLLVCPAPSRPDRSRRVASWTLGLLAMLAKEVAVTLAAPALAVEALSASGSPLRERLRRGAVAALPFALAAVAFLVARHAVLGRLQIDSPWDFSGGKVILTLPSVVWFYLRQSFLPLAVGPSYPLRPVTAATAGLDTLALPLLGCLVAATAAVLLVRRHPRALVGLTLFAAPLLPALNVKALLEEQLVHDRYLYLPLLGLLLALAEPLAVLFVRQPAARARTAATLCATVAFLLSLPVAAFTAHAGRAWRSELELWQRGIEVDPGSAFNRVELARALRDAGRFDEALEHLDRAVAIRPSATPLLNRAEVLLDLGRPADAVGDLEAVVQRTPASSQAWERLAIARSALGQLEAAADALRSGRELAPERRCGLTDNLAVVLVRQGRGDAALAELESVRALAVSGREHNSMCQRSLFHLGMLYAERGRPADAATAFSDFLAVSALDRDPQVQRNRDAARRFLAQLGPPPASP